MKISDDTNMGKLYWGGTSYPEGYVCIGTIAFYGHDHSALLLSPEGFYCKGNAGVLSRLDTCDIETHLSA